MASSNWFSLAGILGKSHCDLQAERHSAGVSGTIKPAYRDSFPVRRLAWKEQRRPFAASHERVWPGSICFFFLEQPRKKLAGRHLTIFFPQVWRTLGRVNSQCKI